MRLSVRLALAGLAAALSAPALIAQQPTSTNSNAKAAQPESERLICRRIQDSGSLARVRRQCYTRAQWDLLAQRQRENSPGMTAMTGSQSGN